MRDITLLDTSLRDGSYAINFSFTSADTAIICQGLENAGFEYIEIGHGAGLNASKSGYGIAAETDEQYMYSAANALKKAKYGMFCIPGVARLEDIDIAASNNMGFIRIGTNVTEVEESEPFIARAKSHGMQIMANFMKSYALPPKEFAEKVKLSEKYGAEIVYIVDSAGGMFANEIDDYYKAIRERTDIKLGFHGHNNLGLAISNSLDAARIGISYLDCSLQGLGRSAGNAATEVLVAALLKLGYELNIDFLKVLESGHKYINPLMNTRGIMPLDIVMGLADFHSSYMHHIQKYATLYSINPALLIIEAGKINKVHVDDAILEQIAKKIGDNEEVFLGKYNFFRYTGGEQDDR